MASIPTLPGIQSRRVTTPRLTIHALFSGPEDGVPVLFVHGNASSSTFWEETMLALPEGSGPSPRTCAVTATPTTSVDATRGVMDCETSGAQGRARHDRYAVGHSLGGSVLWASCRRRRQRLAPRVPGSPCGYRRGENGIPVPRLRWLRRRLRQPRLRVRIGASDHSSEEANASQRRGHLLKPHFRPSEEELLSGLLSEKVGPQKYPGDCRPRLTGPAWRPGRTVQLIHRAQVRATRSSGCWPCPTSRAFCG